MGLDALPRLGGMFAFAIFDAVEGSLVLARDRVGIKPLYYHCRMASFAFASEIKSLAACVRTCRGGWITGPWPITWC